MSGLGVAKNPFFQEYAWLGVPDKPIQPSNKDYKSPYVSKVGGEPAWLHERHFDIAVIDDEHELLASTIPFTLNNNNNNNNNNTSDEKNTNNNDDENNNSSNSSSSSKNEDYEVTLSEKRAQLRREMVPDLPIAKNLTCRICSSKLYLVTQAYAPLGHFDRFLYVFGCNNRTCHNREGTWVAYRAQFEVFDEQLDKIAQDNENSKSGTGTGGETRVIDEKNTEKIKESVNEWKKDQNLDADLENLMQMAAAPLANSSSGGGGNAAKNKKKKNKKKNKQKKDEPVPKFALPCFSLDIFEEPEEELDEEEEGDEAKYASAMANEEYDDEELAAFGKYMNSAAMSSKFTHLEESNDGGAASSSADNDDDASSSLDTLAELSKQVNVSPVLMKFHEEVAKEPNQSIRWQFGGEPLWINDHPKTLPQGYSQKRNRNQGLVRTRSIEEEDDDDEDQLQSDYILKPNVSPYIPPCPSCGSARVFEMQIMPTLIYQLKPDEHCHRKGENQGMEYGTVTVFTCSGQCSGRTKDEIESGSVKIKYVKEYVHVQPAV